MFATLYADMATFTALLNQGADINAHDDEGATPLMWAISDVAKARMLSSAAPTSTRAPRTDERL